MFFWNVKQKHLQVLHQHLSFKPLLIQGHFKDLDMAYVPLYDSATRKGNQFNNADELLQLDGTGKIPNIDGSNLSNIDASNISSGTLDDGRLSENVTKQGNNFNGNNQLIKLDPTGRIPNIDGSNLSNIDASNISSGTLDDGRLSENVTKQGNNFNGNNQLIKLDPTGRIPTLDGKNIYNLCNIKQGSKFSTTVNTNSWTLIAHVALLVRKLTSKVVVTACGDVNNLLTTGGWQNIRLFRNNTALNHQMTITLSNNSQNVPFNIFYVDQPNITGHVFYELKARAGNGSAIYGEAGTINAPLIMAEEKYV